MKQAQLYRRFWLPDIAILAAAALVTTILFWLTDLDIAIQRIFYHPEGRHPWLLGDRFPWLHLYYAGSYPAFLIGFSALGYLAWGAIRPGRHLHRVHAIFLATALIAGPGLVVNGVFKPNWGRPRPKRVVEFGGAQQFRRALERGPREDGKSFPCGHASMGYYLAVFYFLLRRKRPKFAFASLVTAILFGSLIGVSRVAAGAHFASDVLWAGLFVFGVNWALYYFALNVPRREDAAPEHVVTPGGRTLAILGAAAALVVGAIALFLSTPADKTIAREITHAQAAAGPVQVETEFHQAYIDLVISNNASSAFMLSGRSEGFGLPWSRVEERVDESTESDRRVYRVAVVPEGTFTELHIDMRVTVSSDLHKLEITAYGGLVNVIYVDGPRPHARIVMHWARINLPQSIIPFVTLEQIRPGLAVCEIQGARPAEQQ